MDREVGEDGTTLLLAARTVATADDSAVAGFVESFHEGELPRLALGEARRRTTRDAGDGPAG